MSKIKPLEAIMPYPRCPYCGTTIELDQETYNGYNGLITCFICKGKFRIQLSYEDASVFGLDQMPHLLSPPMPLGDPELLEGLLIPAIPKTMYQVYEDANLALAIGIPRATALLCRYIIQQALLLKDIPDQPPEKMVNIAHDKKILSDTSHKQSLAAVFMGGKAGHPQKNWADNINSDDAKQALLFTRRILLELFNPSALEILK